tara:strand:- start:33 stop:1097 length:1065 start_codon:yes stop_codon:yes gene_type:complete
MEEKKKLVFRSDAAFLPEIGTGHLIRCIGMADSLVYKGLVKKSEISFISRSEGPYYIGFELIERSGYKREDISDNCLDWNSEEEAEVITEIDPHLLVVDRLSTELKWMSIVKCKVKHVVSMDDIGSGASLADTVINGIIHINPNCKSSFIGYDYLFLSAPKISSQIDISRKAKRFCASFGGYDSRNLMGFFLSTMKNCDISIVKGALIELLVGSESEEKIKKWKYQAKEVSFKYNIDVALHIRPDNFMEKLENADLAILSGGLTIFDAVSRGIPVIGIPQYRHQLITIEKLSEKMAAVGGSKKMTLDENFFSGLINRMIRSKMERLSMKRVGPKLIDGEGRERITNLLSKFLYC